MTDKEITGSCEDWENGLLGRDPEHVRQVSSEEDQKLNEALGLENVNIKLPVELINALDDLATCKGLYDYRPLIRKVLMEYVNKEALQLLAGVAEDKREAAGKAA